MPEIDADQQIRLADGMIYRPALRTMLLLTRLSLVGVLSAESQPDAAVAANWPKRQEILQTLVRVNDHWQETHPNHGNAFWHRAVYHIGNLEAHAVTEKPEYLAFSAAWAKSNQWMGARSQRPDEWRYDYGESDRHVLFGDWQACFQVYLRLEQLKVPGASSRRAYEVIDYQLSTPADDYLWWSDGLFMVMPLVSEMHRTRGNPLYLTKLRSYYDFAARLMRDADEGLFFRDAKYLYPKHRTAAGKKDFWARGNGWVFAALTMVIDDLPDNHPDRKLYLEHYLAMARKLIACQHPDGYWTRSLIDPNHAPGPETSGTAFFVRGLAWGLRTGVLHQPADAAATLRAWNFLSRTAVQPDGTVGFIQPIGERAIPGQVVNATSTADFGVGAWLLAAAEMVRLNPAARPMPTQSK